MKKLNHYLRLEYPIRVEPDPDGGFIASIPDLPGCYTSGETKREVLERIEESKASWLESYHAVHGNAPEPGNPTSYSGRLLLRLPKYLHKKLHEGAKEEGVSVNQYLVALVAEGIFRGELSRARGETSQFKERSENRLSQSVRRTQASQGYRVGESAAKFRKPARREKRDSPAKSASQKS